MSKREKAVYAPGELSRVRDKLGVVDKNEAQQLAQKLGGEVGIERTVEEENARHSKPKRTRYEKVDVKIGDYPVNHPKHRIELASEEKTPLSPSAAGKSVRRKDLDPLDDPAVPIKVSYWDRVKMDKYAGQPEFDIKSPGQVFYSIISLLGDIADYVSPTFINQRITEYYKKIEILVLSTRSMFPRNNLRRNEILKKSSPLVYAILDVIRYWNIEKISSDIARIQAHPKNTKVGDFADILRAVYKPLYILELTDPDAHIRGAYKILYKLLYIENPMDAQKKYQESIRTALSAYFEIRRDIHYLLYPLLMKTVSSRFVPYERFFTDRKNRIMAFLNVSESDQLNPAALNAQAEASKAEGDDKQQEASPGQSEDSGQSKDKAEEQEVKEEVISEEEKARREAEAAEKKALERGLKTLEALFPKAGWDRLSAFPDLYPYFADTFDLRKGVVYIAPTDPMQQVFVLMRILEELFFGLRYVSFGSIPNLKGGIEEVDSLLGAIINNWHSLIEISFEKEYLPRMSEYIRILESSPEERATAYAKKVIAELHWTKRFYFLPYYKFESLIPPPFHKNEITPVYTEIQKLRKYLTIVAGGIEQGNRAGGAESHAPCDGIDNPWESYVFQVPNPLSIRLDALLAPRAKNNAALVFFCLAVTAVLDYLVNDENSWAYGPRPGPLFRSVNGEGAIPLTGVDTRIDAEAIFKQSLRQQQKKKQA